MSTAHGFALSEPEKVNMPKFKVNVSQDWKEPGRVTVEAKSKEEARRVARNMLRDGSAKIRWESQGMKPGGCHVDSVLEEEA
jgi:hypothetical protein